MHTTELERIAQHRLLGGHGRGEAPPADASPMVSVFLFSAAALAAAFLGLFRIEYYSIWLDEYTTLMATENTEVLVAYLTTFPEQHPFYYFLIKWLGVNDTLMEIRLFSLVCGVLALAPLYVIGSRLFSTGTARRACFLFALSPFMLYYNQEGRMYALLTLLCLTQAACMIQWTMSGGRRAIAAFIFFSILSLYTHFFASFLLAAEFFWLLIWLKKNPNPRIRWVEAIGAFMVVGLAYLPWLLHIISNLGGMAQGWRSLYNIAFAVPYTFLRFGAGYGIFPLHYDVKLHLSEYLPAAIFWCTVCLVVYLPAAILAARRLRRLSPAQGLAFSAAFLPILLIVAASFFKNVASERYVIYSAPFFYLIVASVREEGAPGSRVLKNAAIAMPVLLFAAGIGFHFYNPAFGKTDYKAASAYILENTGSGTRIVCRPDLVAGPMEHYLKDRATVTPYRAWTPVSSDTEVWLVERMANTPDPLRLDRQQFEKTDEKIFPRENGLRVSRWRKKEPAQAEGGYLPAGRSG